MDQEKSLPIEERLQLAIAAINDGTVPSVRQAANLFGVPRSTLRSRLDGSQSHNTAYQRYQRFSAAEEASINHILM